MTYISTLDPQRVKDKWLYDYMIFFLYNFVAYKSLNTLCFYYFRCLQLLTDNVNLQKSGEMY